MLAAGGVEGSPEASPRDLQFIYKDQSCNEGHSFFR